MEDHAIPVVQSILCMVLLASRAFADEQAPDRKVDPPDPQELIQGTWIPVAFIKDGDRQEIPAKDVDEWRLIVKGNSFRWQIIEGLPNDLSTSTFQLTAAKKPFRIVVTTTTLGDQEIWESIVKIDGDTMTLAIPPDDAKDELSLDNAFVLRREDIGNGQDADR